MKKNIKRLATALLVLITVNQAGLSAALASSAPEIPAIKIGTIAHDEIWSRRVAIIGDVTIPESVTVTIEAGTVLSFADYDLANTGPHPDQCEIIAHGTLDIRSTPENPVRVESLKKESFLVTALDKNTRIVRFSPYKIETEEMRKEFRSFKIQYLVLWSLIYAMWILRP